MVKQLENGQPKNFLIGTVIDSCKRARFADFDEELEKLEKAHDLEIERFEKKQFEIFQRKERCKEDFKHLRQRLVTFGCYKEIIEISKAREEWAKIVCKQLAVKNGDEDGKVGRTL